MWEPTEEAIEDYEAAYKFCCDTHLTDMNRIDSLDGLMEDFDKFFYEFVYVVLASGFRARVAARLTPRIVECQGDMEKMQEVFKNQRKLNAIEAIWKKKDDWKSLRETLTDIDSLANLPYIGQITKYHLARNIGVVSCSKPDLHLCRWAEKVSGDGSEEMVSRITQGLAKRYKRKQGTVDFALWVWLMHDRGDEKECCHGGFELR